MRNEIERYWRELDEMVTAMPRESMVRTAEVLLDCHARGGTVFVVGNGGSASTASHFACDLAKGTRTPGLAAFRVIPLTDNVPLMTAWANDTSYDRVFAEQLAALIRPNDVVVLISTSGNSTNVLVASEVAHGAGAISIALTGEAGGMLAQQADLTIYVPARTIEQAEDAHLAVTHSLCVALRSRLARQALLASPQPRRSGLHTPSAPSTMDGRSA